MICYQAPLVALPIALIYYPIMTCFGLVSEHSAILPRSTTANIAISLLLAILVNQELKGVAFFRTVFYLPVVTSIIAVSMIWMWIYNYQVGLLNSILGLFGLGPFDWLRNPKLALHSLAIMRVWKGVGWNMVIYLAGLQGIPRYIYEAATIDGASAWTQFRRLTWPLLRPVTYYIIVMGLISTFQSLVKYAMTQGGPLDSTALDI